MGRIKNQLTSKRFGPWGAIIVTPDQPNDLVKQFPLDAKGRLKNPFQSTRHDRSHDHQKYLNLPAHSADKGFLSSHFCLPQKQLIKEQEEANSPQNNNISLGDRDLAQSPIPFNSDESTKMTSDDDKIDFDPLFFVDANFPDDLELIFD